MTKIIRHFNFPLLLSLLFISLLSTCTPMAGPTPIELTPTSAPTVAPTVRPVIMGSIEGQALIGPTCPVVKIDQPCPDQPYQTTLAIYDQNRQLVTQVQTDAEGKFKVELRPGIYTIAALPATVVENGVVSEAMLPRAEEQTVTVVEGQMVQVQMLFDSGMR